MATLKKQMQVVQKLIKLNRFDEARDVLMTISHKKAKQMLKAINKKSPERDEYTGEDDDEDDLSPRTAKGSPNLVFIVTSLLVLIAILGGGVAASTQEVELLTGSTVVTVDDCGVQRWYNTSNGAFADMTSFSLFGLIYVSGNRYYTDQIAQQNVVEYFQERINTLEALDTPECAQQAKEYLVAALTASMLAAQRFDVDSPSPAFYQMGQMLDNQLLAARELQSLNVRFAGPDVQAVDMLTDTSCPAYEWVMRQLYIDNQFMLMVFVFDDIFEGSNLLDSIYNYIRSLRQQEVYLKNSTPPPCLGQAREHLVDAIGYYAMMFEAATGSDQYGVQVHNDSALEALGKFYDEIEALGLDPHQFGRGFMLGY